MNIHWQLLRLHLLWFILYNLTCIFIFLTSGDAILVFLIKIFGYPAIYLISKPFNSRYDYYFKNMGLNTQRVFINICLMDLMLFLVLIIPLTFMF
jgi:hypothetical protein